MGRRIERIGRRIERALVGLAMVTIGWLLERRLVRAIERRAVRP